MLMVISIHYTTLIEITTTISQVKVLLMKTQYCDC